FKSAGRSVTSPTPTITGMRSTDAGEFALVMVFCFHFQLITSGLIALLRHCEPPGRHEVPPDDRLREAITSQPGKKHGLLRSLRSSQRRGRRSPTPPPARSCAPPPRQNLP